jgi:HPt (histidine-containing phosphotransfer) domain-containing protein
MSEQPSVQVFIAQRQAEVLARAIDTLETCSDDDLPAQAHRLAGTLGTYQLDGAQQACRTLEEAASHPAASGRPLPEVRAATLEVLKAAAQPGEDEAMR